MRAMLDIETLAVDSNAVIAAIGVCLFNYQETVKTDLIMLDITEDQGFIDPGTLLWWLKQDDSVMRNMLTGTTPFVAAYDWLVNMVAGCEVWANSPSFDCVITRHWCARHGRKVPWHYRDERDMRTMYALAKARGIALPPVDGPAHDAGADAYRQAIHLLAIEAAL